MTLLWLFLGWAVYTAILIKVSECYRDCEWRAWIESFRPKFGPDNRDRYGVHRRHWIKGNRDRDEQ